MWGKCLRIKSLVFPIECSDQLILFRKYVSRRAAIKGRAVLEGVGLCADTINACFRSCALDDEEAVQEGLIKWSGGEGHQPPTWGVLIEAMNYARIAQQHIKDLQEKLGLLVCCLHRGTVCGRRVCAYEYERACVMHTYL